MCQSNAETLHVLHLENSILKTHWTLKSLSYSEVCLSLLLATFLSGM